MAERETGWAKINLALHVRARRDDGYHEIDSLFTFADRGDELSAVEDEALSLAVTGPFAAGLDGPDNLVLRAAAALHEAAGVARGARLTLDKRLPVASGIGGGSADAAAALRVLSRLWGIADQGLLHRIAAGLGADVPACLASRTLRGTGRGDDLVVLDKASLTGTPILLVNPLVPLATGPVFAGWDGVDRGALADGAPLESAIAGRNDLQPPAVALVPEIGPVIAELAEGAVLARMSGSGATCFALFAEEGARDMASARIAGRWPDYWRMEARLR